MYMLRPDLDDLVGWLNAEQAVAWLMPDGEVSCWRATMAVDPELVAARSCTGLWFVGSVLTTPSPTGELLQIDDPFAGWLEPLGANGEPRDPPANHNRTCVFRLQPQLAIDPTWGLSRSSLQWIGGHCSILGREPAEHENAWWERLRRHVKKVADPDPTMARQRPWVFPAAGEALRTGIPRSKWS
jgi:hypothetical protein